MSGCKKRVVVAMSGGVDSSLAACLLKSEGFEVIGLTMKLIPIVQAGSDWRANDATPTGRSLARAGCCSYLDVGDARQVAQKLGLPHYVVDLTKEFETKVIKNFCKQYLAGYTPNPCIRCNQYIKFGLLLKKARQLGADYIATGHYARIEYCPKSRRYLLKKGLDRDNDQSYVLFTMTQEQLRSSLFPLGGLTKQKVRKLAFKFGLPVYAKDESQEICFITDNDYKRFLKVRYEHRIRPGRIVHLDGQVLGRHEGISFYTIGQRKGLGIAAGVPLYVVAINRHKNTIVVAGKKDLLRRELTACQTNWIGLSDLTRPLKLKAKIRYNHRGASAWVSPLDKRRVRVRFSQAQPAVTPGQAVVFYDGDIVAGGAWIE